MGSTAATRVAATDAARRARVGCPPKVVRAYLHSPSVDVGRWCHHHLAVHHRAGSPQTQPRLSDPGVISMVVH
jgi:hypothetical protein